MIIIKIFYHNDILHLKITVVLSLSHSYHYIFIVIDNMILNNINSSCSCFILWWYENRRIKIEYYYLILNEPNIFSFVVFLSFIVLYFPT